MWITAVVLAIETEPLESGLARVAAVTVSAGAILYALRRMHLKVVRPFVETTQQIHQRYIDIGEQGDELDQFKLALRRTEAKQDRNSKQIAGIAIKQAETAELAARVAEAIRPTNGDRSSISDRLDKTKAMAGRAEATAQAVKAELQEHRISEGVERSERQVVLDGELSGLRDGHQRLAQSHERLRSTVVAGIEGTARPEPDPPATGR